MGSGNNEMFLQYTLKCSQFSYVCKFLLPIFQLPRSRSALRFSAFFLFASHPHQFFVLFEALMDFTSLSTNALKTPFHLIIYAIHVCFLFCFCFFPSPPFMPYIVFVAIVYCRFALRSKLEPLTSISIYILIFYAMPGMRFAVLGSNDIELHRVYTTECSKYHTDYFVCMCEYNEADRVEKKKYDFLIFKTRY